jgi:NAD(P)-dependent dehydrogenase (short-subunit alcohol dehydrogenase family)
MARTTSRPAGVDAGLDRHAQELRPHAGSLDGQVAIVTGAARGIGRAYALGLAAEGAAVVIADLLPGNEVVSEIEAAGGTAVSIPVDVSDPESTAALAEATLARFGRIDILVNNAAYFRYVVKHAIEQIPIDEWDKAFAVNVRGTWLATCAVLPAMKAQATGRIINVSSMTVWKGTPNFAHYVASKAAIIGLTRVMATEFGPHGITVNTVVPDFTPHDIENQSDPTIDARNVTERVLKRTQQPEDMVGAVVFLAGPGAAFITGQSLLVNGGARYL